MHKIIRLLFVCGAGGWMQAAVAQAPLPSAAVVPEKMPFDIPIGRSITRDQAKQLANRAEAEAKKRNWKMAISIVDPAGELVYFEKIDDTQFASIMISQNKAYTAARFRRATSLFYDGMETGHASMGALDPKLVASPGGFPIVESGKLIGGIGCAAGPGFKTPLYAKRRSIPSNKFMPWHDRSGARA